MAACPPALSASVCVCVSEPPFQLIFSHNYENFLQKIEQLKKKNNLPDYLHSSFFFKVIVT